MTRPLITDLDQYSDHIHYSPDVCQELARRLLEEEPMTAQEIAPRMEAFRDFLSTYDFLKACSKTPVPDEEEAGSRNEKQPRPVCYRRGCLPHVRRWRIRRGRTAARVTRASS